MRRSGMVKMVAAALAMVLALAGGVAVDVAAPAAAGASTIGNIGQIPCDSFKPGPNSVDHCVGWLAGTTFVFRVEATHAVGWWGPNYDPGTWTVAVHKYWPNGSLVGLEYLGSFGDWATPVPVQVAAPLGTATEVRWTSTQRVSPQPITYRSCAGILSVGPVAQFDSVQGWPFGYREDNNSGPYCQHGYFQYGPSTITLNQSFYDPFMDPNFPWTKKVTHRMY